MGGERDQPGERSQWKGPHTGQYSSHVDTFIVFISCVLLVRSITFLFSIADAHDGRYRIRTSLREGRVKLNEEPFNIYLHRIKPHIPDSLTSTTPPEQTPPMGAADSASVSPHDPTNNCAADCDLPCLPFLLILLLLFR